MTSAVTGFDTETLELLATSLREVFTAHPDAAGVAAALAELGWDEVSASDPAAANTLLFAEQGRALAISRLLDDVVLRELTPALPTATGRRAVLYRHEGHALLLGPVDDHAELVSIDGAGNVGLLVSQDLSARPVRGFDPGSGWLCVDEIPPARPGAAGNAGQRAVAAARRALSAEIIGICAAALDSAVAHTTVRSQYGRPLATFQAVRHRLAESHVSIEAARAALAAAWADDSVWTARLAKQRAGQAQAEVMRHAVQVFGAMGLSQENDLHRRVTRAAALDLLLGSHTAQAEQVGADLLAGADLLRVVEI